MNYKLEKFWNSYDYSKTTGKFRWTINLKSFEIENNGGLKMKRKDEL